MMTTMISVLSPSQRTIRPLENQISTECIVDRALTSSPADLVTLGRGRP